MKIFISYSSLEKEAALEKRELLINNGFSVWMAQILPSSAAVIAFSGQLCTHF